MLWLSEEPWSGWAGATGCCSVAKSCPTLSNPVNCSTPAFPALHHLPQSAQTESLSQWCHPTNSSSHRLLPLPSFLPSIRVFSSESAQVASSSQSTGASASASVLLMNIQDWFPLGLTHLSSLKSKELSRVFSSTTIWKHQFFGAQPSLWSSSHIYITTALEWTELNSSAPRTKGMPILCGLFFLKSFYWSTVDLQYCVSFHFTASWFSHIYTYIHTYIHSFF